jgi:drug/metabolite transporter (DMT)-like permease
MIAVAFALTSAVLFGCVPVVLKFAFRRCADAQIGALATVLTTLAVTGVAAVADWSWSSAVWPFFLAGVLSPGVSHLLFLAAIDISGSARTSVVIGTAPLVAITIAVTLLGEPIRATLLLGGVLVVAGSIALARERGRPPGFRRIGLVLAFGAAAMFASRDSLVRWLAGDTSVRPELACAASVLGGALVVGGYLVARRGAPAVATSLRSNYLVFAPAGMMFGLSFVALFEAYYRGRVTVVSPLIATESLWSVIASALILRRHELVGRRLVLGAAFVVLGGALIGIFR